MPSQYRTAQRDAGAMLLKPSIRNIGADRLMAKELVVGYNGVLRGL